MRRGHGNSLVVAVGARMIVGPGDRRSEGIVGDMSGGVGLRMFRVKKMGPADATQSAERNPQVLMIARGHDAAAPLAKVRDALAISHSQTVAGVDRKQPQLVKVRS